MNTLPRNTKPSQVALSHPSQMLKCPESIIPPHSLSFQTGARHDQPSDNFWMCSPTPTPDNFLSVEARCWFYSTYFCPCFSGQIPGRCLQRKTVETWEELAFEYTKPDLKSPVLCSFCLVAQEKADRKHLSWVFSLSFLLIKWNEAYISGSWAGTVLTGLEKLSALWEVHELSGPGCAQNGHIIRGTSEI